MADTTDTQMVRAVVLSGINSAFRVQCDFITGSNAQGCMVVLVGEFDNVTVNLKRDNNTEVIIVTYPVSCYKKVLAFDIEYDGSIGTVAVSRELMRNFSTVVQCSSTPDLHMLRKKCTF